MALFYIKKQQNLMLMVKKIEETEYDFKDKKTQEKPILIMQIMIKLPKVNTAPMMY